MSEAVHPFAVVQAGTQIGKGTKVWQFASVLRRAKLGAFSSVGACAVVDGARLGLRARIGHGGQVHPGVVAGNDLFVGPGAILCNDLWPWLESRDFDLEALIEGRAVSVIAQDSVSIGAGAIILPGVTLGRGCVVAAGAVVATDVPPGMLHNRDGRHIALPAPGRRMRLAA